MLRIKRNGLEMIGHERPPMIAAARQMECHRWHVLISYLYEDGSIFKELDFILPDREHVITLILAHDEGVRLSHLSQQGNAA